MNFTLDSIKSGVLNEPPRIIIYGAGGTGKSTFAANAPKPIFIQTEDGCGNLDVARFPLCSDVVDPETGALVEARGYQQVIAQLTTLAKEEHQFETLVIDSLDWLERMIHNQIISDRPKSSNGSDVKHIEDYGYGNGVKYAIDYWSRLFHIFKYLRDHKKMMIVCLAHAVKHTVRDPQHDPYDQWNMKLQHGDKVSACKLWEEWADIVGFVDYKVMTFKEKESFGRKVTKAIGEGDRVLRVTERPSFFAKNRYSLPDEIDMPQNQTAWNVLVDGVPFLKTKYGQPSN